MSGVDIDSDPEADEVHAHAGFGLAYGINRFVEVGAKVLPLRFHRNADYLDLELYLRWSFVQTRVADVGVQFVLQLPTNRPRVFGSSIGIPVRIRMGTVARLDLGLELELIVRDADPSDDVNVNVDPNLDIPVALSFNITPRFYLGGSFGLYVYDFDRVAFNGGGHVGYSIGRDTPLLDLTASFKVYGAPDGRFAAFPGDGRYWEVIGGVRVYFAL